MNTQRKPQDEDKVIINFMPEGARGGKHLPTSRTSDQFVARFPDGMRAKIKALAATNGRSMNQEIIILLRRAIEMPSAGSEPKECERHEQLSSAAIRIAKEFDSLSDSAKIAVMEKIFEVMGREE